jgi:hypothetical protein
MTQYKDFFLSFGKLIHGSGDHLSQFTVFHRAICAPATYNVFLVEIGNILQYVPIGLPPKMIHTCVYSNPSQPRVKGGTVIQFAQRFENLYKHFLRNIPGILAVVSEAISQFIDAVTASINYFVKSIKLAALEAFHQNGTVYKWYTIKVCYFQLVFLPPYNMKSIIAIS